MTSRDFCYFLQGYFELMSAGKGADYAPPFNFEIYKCIQNHLKLVFKCEEYNISTSYTFCHRLDTLLEFESYEDFNERRLVNIRNQLNGIFIHEIDNTFTGDKQELQQIHDGDKYDDRKELMRC